MSDVFDMRQSSRRIGRVRLKLRDLEAGAAFYENILGLRRISAEAGRVVLGTTKAALLELIAAPEAAARNPRDAGLFHTAFLLPSRASLGAWLAFAMANGVPVQGASDHVVSEAFYLADPEGNGIEVYADTPPSAWHDASGKLLMTTQALDTDGVLGAGQDGAWQGFPEDGLIGHIHLQVGDTAASERFYGNVLGFDLTKRLPKASFFGADGYHHQLACNTWNSQGAGTRPLNATGLDGFDLLLHRPEDQAAILERAAQAGLVAEQQGDRAVLHDPWGNSITLRAA
ncbi:MAG: VOC family protein [Alphaproteobacteria bacterium]|nr:VOC family protein [Alphaproteobacteria bacterium]